MEQLWACICQDIISSRKQTKNFFNTFKNSFLISLVFLAFYQTQMVSYFKIISIFGTDILYKYLIYFSKI